VASNKSRSGRDDGASDGPPYKVLWERALLRESKIELQAIAVGMAIASYGDGDGTKCRPSQAKLGKDLGVSERTIRKWVGRLETSEWVAVDLGRNGRASVYTLLVPTGTVAHTNRNDGAVRPERSRTPAGTIVPPTNTVTKPLTNSSTNRPTAASRIASHRDPTSGDPLIEDWGDVQSPPAADDPWADLDDEPVADNSVDPARLTTQEDLNALRTVAHTPSASPFARLTPASNASDPTASTPENFAEDEPNPRRYRSKYASAD
jgi:hypothetical protein